MRISRTERVLVLLTAAFVLFAFGYFLGRNTALSEVTVQTSAQSLLRDDISAASDPDTQEDPAAEPAQSEQQTAAPAQLVDINTADAALLDTLPGIGPVLAARIIADREANGPFQTVEDITRVSGIGEKMLEKLYDLITVG